MEGDQVYEVEEEKIMWQQFSESGQGEMKVRRERKRVREEDMAAGPKKKRLSSEQVRLLEMNFGREQKLEAARKDRLATQLGLAPRQVAVWFQNRRVRWKCRQMEEECVKLKKMHDLVLDDKCQLEDQVLKLREQLSEAHKELRKLSNECYGKATATSVGERNHSPNSLLFMEGLANHHHHSHYHHPNTLTGIEGCGDDHSLFCAPESECHCHSYLKGLDEWTYMYMLQ